MEKLKDKLKEDLREQVKECSSYTDWDSAIKTIADWLTKIDKMRTIKGLKKLAIDEIGWEEEDWDTMLNELKEE